MVLQGKPQSFYEQRGPLKEDYKPYAAELLGADENSNDVPLVHRNFIEGCMRVGLIEFEEGSQQLINLATPLRLQLLRSCQIC